MSKPFSLPDGKRAALSLSFDDASLSQVDVGIPIMDAHGVRGTFYVSPSNVEQRVDAWRRAITAGHEIGNHTFTHPCSGNFPWARDRALEDFTLARMEEELARADEHCERWLGVKPVTFAYPCGQKFVGRGAETKSYVPLVSRRFLAGRGFRDEFANHPLRCDLAQLFGMDGDMLPFESLRNLLEKAVQTGGWLVLVFHKVGPMAQQAVTSETLNSLCQYASQPENGVWIDTVAAIARHVSSRAGPAPENG